MSRRRRTSRRTTGVVRWLGLTGGVAFILALAIPRGPSVVAAPPAPDWMRGLLAVQPTTTFRLATDVEAPRRIRVGGQIVHFRVEHADDEPRAVIAFYRERFAHTNDWLLRFVERSSGARAPEMRQAVAAFTSLWSAASDDSGMIVALDPVEPGLEPEDLERRLARFGETGRLAELWVGRVVYAYARGDGGSEVIAAWTDESFDVHSLAADLGRRRPHLDLPPDAEPLLSVELLDEGVPCELAVLRSRGGPADASAEFERRLLDAGWRRESPEHRASKAVELRRESTQIQLTAAADPDTPGHSFVSLIQWKDT